MSHAFVRFNNNYWFIGTRTTSRAGARAVDLGGPSVYQGGPKFEIKHKSRCLQKSKLVNWGGQALGTGPDYKALPSIIISIIKFMKNILIY